MSIPLYSGFPGGTVVKSACQYTGCSRLWFNLGLERSPGVGNGNLLRILAWKISWAEEPVRLQSMGLQSVRHNLATEYTHVRAHTHTPPTRDSVFRDFMA